MRFQDYRDRVRGTRQYFEAWQQASAYSFPTCLARGDISVRRLTGRAVHSPADRLEPYQVASRRWATKMVAPHPHCEATLIQGQYRQSDATL
eukprot:349960-Chlamydomonas_euryale.AAC.3